MSEVKVVWSKTFAPAVPGEGSVLESIGRRAAEMLRHRIRDLGRDSQGRAIRSLAQGTPFTSSPDDPRFPHSNKRHKRGTPVQAGETVRLYVGPRGGPYGAAENWRDAVIWPEGYGQAKAQGGGQRRRNLSLTGKLWRSLRVRIQGGGVNSRGTLKDRVIRLDFAGSDRDIKVATKNGTRSMQMKDKARLAFYGPSSSTDQVVGQQSDLMALTQSELEELGRLYVLALRLFR